MDRMQDVLKSEYGVNVNSSEYNKKVTDDWDKAQSLVSSSVTQSGHNSGELANDTCKNIVDTQLFC